jgi:hypothetical protein
MMQFEWSLMVLAVDGHGTECLKCSTTLGQPVREAK